MARVLSLDYESFCELDLKKVGAYRYAEHESCEVLMASYAFDDGPVKLWVPFEGEPMPADLRDALTDDTTEIHAWNAAFERIITEKVLFIPAPPEKYRCTMVQCLAAGLPGKLETAGEAARLAQNQQKLKSGAALIRKFCRPRKPTKTDASTRWDINKPKIRAQWEEFKRYCRMDVEAERALATKLRKFKLSAIEQHLWEIDQRINDRGIAVDLELVHAAIAMGTRHRDALIAEAQRITGLDNPNSRDQLLTWLNESDDFEGTDLDPEEYQALQDLKKKTVERILGRDDLSDVVRKVLELRQQIAKASLKKYETIVRAVCDDGRVRGMMQFYGAARTGRWAGRLLQVQNLPSPTIEDLDQLKLAREMVKAGDYEGVAFLWPSVSDVLATLIRTALVAPPGRQIMAVDFSAIEAVCTAWFAGCEWRLEVFRTHGKIYEASASTAFKVPFQEFLDYKKRTGKHHPLRKKGKVIELACGYQGGEGAMIQMGALDMGIPREELKPMVDAWRDASPEIAGHKNENGWREGGFWADVEKAAKRAIRNPGQVFETHRCKFVVSHGMLRIILPSGRALCYLRPSLKVVPKFGKPKEVIHYWGIHQKTKQWCELQTYGGKLVENIVQAFARDCLAAAMFKIEARGYEMIMLVHDEIVLDLLIGFGSLKEVLAIMAESLPFAPGLPLKGAGYENSPFYYKD